ncbi:hypothetical protein KIW84_033306 [Lathyrus oleraceus]|uniref:3-deoxy-8-phosphooctulonate synthase n=1 Tax=Pisum sativum TaxID=3888 RepID=A0A9D4XWJ1_PEA|nr:hypothetical protein KIW84_033306 [Pisum sativum]
MLSLSSHITSSTPLFFPLNQDFLNRIASLHHYPRDNTATSSNLLLLPPSSSGGSLSSNSLLKQGYMKYRMDMRRFRQVELVRHSSYTPQYLKRAVACNEGTTWNLFWPCEPVGRVADIIQIPAFLCRQTDLLVAAAKTGKIINIKKGQFCAPSVMANSAEKVRLAGNPNVMVCERGTMFGYNDLIVDPRNLEWMREANCPVVADITHSLQQPAGKKLDGGGVASGGLRELIPCIARTSVAVGVDGIFMEVHDDPLNAPVDGPTQWPLRHLEELLEELIAISRVSKGKKPFNIDLTPFRE